MATRRCIRRVSNGSGRCWALFACVYQRPVLPACRKQWSQLSLVASIDARPRRIELHHFQICNFRRCHKTRTFRRMQVSDCTLWYPCRHLCLRPFNSLDLASPLEQPSILRPKLCDRKTYIRDRDNEHYVKEGGILTGAGALWPLGAMTVGLPRLRANAASRRAKREIGIEHAPDKSQHIQAWT
ncbi:hypothetical protein FA95DRAFT_1424650 [Auriscalpium vulgare]|uniref:Uncharacterized protein n=1 Tax=Auriscalpium vulgare TaxID=40419 RepID=A0ACB8RPS0_9AGAM|nr:hypothetical protein FA95DRAFT_1424650 [Auriscalpium vulgare]